MARVLCSWVGLTDLRAPERSEVDGVGPLAQALTQGQYDAAYLISDRPSRETGAYLRWLRPQTSTRLELRQVELTGPTRFAEIYEAATRVVDEAITKNGKPELTFHLSPGTPAMAAVWIILAKTRYPAELIESSREHGVRLVSVPFDISAEFIPDLLRKPDERLEALSAGLPPEAPEFSNVVHRSPVMKRQVAMARRVAPRSVPVLIEGESGTGKELFARAIHRSGPRCDKPFVAVNCGAIPSELVESQLFGHEKGAFTGATVARQGYFEAAHGGTLFLDEIGELSMPAQVKLLRVLQESEVVRVGATKPLSIDVRIIAATNRDLVGEIREGRFREDLFYRLAVAVLKIPPLRVRGGDVVLLIDHLLALVNEESRQEPGYIAKRLAPTARNLLKSHEWPGNVRELYNTLRRAALWTTGAVIEAEDVREALLPATGMADAGILERSLGDGFSLPGLLRNVAKHYLERALEQTHGNKSEAARLLGIASYQTLTNWLKRYGLEQ